MNSRSQVHLRDHLLRSSSDPCPRELADRIALTRREFLRGSAGLALGSALLHASPIAYAATPVSKRKVIVVTFGGGARDQETFAPEGQENIPHLMRELIPQSAFFTQVVNRGILGHYVATASLATGVYETINNFASLPPESPTLRRGRPSSCDFPAAKRGKDASTRSRRKLPRPQAKTERSVKRRSRCTSPPSAPCGPTSPSGRWSKFTASADAAGNRCFQQNPHSGPQVSCRFRR